jgi:hypothetical protein
MNTSTFTRDGLSIIVGEQASTTTVRWLGVSDSRDPAVHLLPYLTSLLDLLSGKDVLVDLRDLEYMNSATVSPLINFVKNLDAKGARTTLTFDATVPWQKVNAQCMRAIARTLSNVKVPLRTSPSPRRGGVEGSFREDSVT